MMDSPPPYTPHDVKYVSSAPPSAPSAPELYPDLPVSQLQHSPVFEAQHLSSTPVFPTPSFAPQVINPQGSNGQFADTNASPLRVKGGYVDVGIHDPMNDESKDTLG